MRETFGGQRKLFLQCLRSKDYALGVQRLKRVSACDQDGSERREISLPQVKLFFAPLRFRAQIGKHAFNSSNQTPSEDSNIYRVAYQNTDFTETGRKARDTGILRSATGICMGNNCKIKSDIGGICKQGVHQALGARLQMSSDSPTPGALTLTSAFSSPYFEKADRFTLRLSTPATLRADKSINA
ncbi:hypothetical protein CCUS01_08428 [Colletotrichum cuscutae]|uniref:Uncharacterized protein n=1 Tax=Colletotrichum cuscutae TaxID=1209917 RepID=A0AAI9USX7_9PEZI|nr:hypothetical protein CCUS01_08428 [Colletotrichum cuscutae]